MKRIFTSESVTKGHPDKVADQIADGVLDELLKEDPYARCACEVTVEFGAVHIFGEITAKAGIDYEKTARDIIRSIGYTEEEYGFSADTAKISCTVREQSEDIAMGVNNSYDDSSSLGAGDQGMMFGYASLEGENYMPLALVLSRRLTQSLTSAREKRALPWLRPDGKAQVSLEYTDNAARRIEAVVVSAQHDPDIPLDELREEIIKHIIIPSLPEAMIDSDTKFFINPTGRFVIGGPAADTGLTGRKLVADTYGGYAHHGGGAFSGKDATKVDRTAALALRNIAKTIVASGAASECEIQAAYAIGVAEPVSLAITSISKPKISEERIISWIGRHFDMRPEGMIERFSLRSPIFLQTAGEGPFGRADISVPWEIIDDDALSDLKSLI